MFPSPHSGILFLLHDKRNYPFHPILVSVPSFGDSFFIGVKLEAIGQVELVVSVPSFGDSFFIQER